MYLEPYLIVIKYRPIYTLFYFFFIKTAKCRVHETRALMQNEFDLFCG